jgi:membrane fusion protein
VAAHESIFRPEVIEARRKRIEGDVLLALPVKVHALAGMLIVIAAVISLWVTFGTYTRSEVAPGLLVTDLPATKVVASRPGRIAELFVRDGDIVRVGQKIATIWIEQPAENGSSATADSLRALDVQGAMTREQILLARDRASADTAQIVATIEGLGRQWSNLTAQSELQEQLVESVRETFDRMTPVMQRGFVSRIEYEQRRQAWINARQQLVQLRQQMNANRADELKSRAQLARVKVDAASEVASAKIAAAGFTGQRAQALAQRAYVIVAPTSGRVTSLQGAVGRSVDASPIMEIIPDGSSLHAEVYAPSRAIGFVKPGQEVRLLYDAFPYQRFGSFGGRVTRVSRTAFDPRDIAAPIKAEEPVFRIDIALQQQSVGAYGSRLELQSGMTLSANLILDRRSFAGWLTEPLNAVLRKNK